MPVVDVGHRPEQPGAGSEQRLGHGEVGRQRQRCVVLLRREPGPERELEPAALQPLDLLLGKLDARRAPCDLCGLDAPCELIEAGRQIVRRHGVVGELGAAADEGAFDGVQRGRSIGRHPDREHHGGSLDVGEEAGGPLRQDRRIERRTAIREIDGDGAIERLDVERVAGPDEPADVGDGVVEDDVVAGELDRERLVEIGRRGRIEGHEAAVGPVGVPVADWSCGRCLGGGEHLGRVRLGDLVALADPVEPGPHRVGNLTTHLHQLDSMHPPPRPSTVPHLHHPRAQAKNTTTSNPCSRPPTADEGSAKLSRDPTCGWQGRRAPESPQGDERSMTTPPAVRRVRLSGGRP